MSWESLSNSQITAVTDDEHKKTSWKKWQGECEPVTDRQATILGGWQNISCSTLMTMTGILDQMILGKLLTRWV